MTGLYSQNGIYHFDLKLRFSDIDAANITYFARYPSFFDESFIAAMRDENIDWNEKEKLGFLIPIVEQKTNYFYPLKQGNTAKIYMVIRHIGNRSFRSEHIIGLEEGKDEILVAKGYITRVTVDYLSFKPKTIPNIMKRALNKYYIEEDNWKKFEKSLIRK